MPHGRGSSTMCSRGMRFEWKEDAGPKPCPTKQSRNQIAGGWIVGATKQRSRDLVTGDKIAGGTNSAQSDGSHAVVSGVVLYFRQAEDFEHRRQVHSKAPAQALFQSVP